MRFHSAAAFILAKGFGIRNNELAVDNRNGVNSMVPQPLRMQGSDDDLRRAQDANLDALRELSSSFKELAQTDLSNVFGSEESFGASTPDPSFNVDYGDPSASFTATNQAPAAPEAPAAPASSSFFEEYMASRAAAEREAAAATPPPPPTSIGPPAASTSPPQTAAASAPPATSYSPMSYTPPQAQVQPQAQTGTGAGSSYLDAMAGAQSTSAPKQSYAQSAGISPTTLAASNSQPGSYMDALNSGAVPAASSAPAADSRPGSYMDSIAASVSMFEPATSSYPPAPPQEQPPAYVEPPVIEPPVVAHVDQVQEQAPVVMEEPTQLDYKFMEQHFSADNVDQIEPGSASNAQEPFGRVVRTVQPNPGFDPDAEDFLSAGSAPKIEEPVGKVVRAVKPNPGFDPDTDWNPLAAQNPLSRPVPKRKEKAPLTPPPQPMQKARLGAERMSGYIPNLQGGQGMDLGQNTPKAKPKRPVFSKMMSGVHSDLDERVVRDLVEEVPTAPANTNNNPFAQQRPQGPMSVFAERVSGIVAGDNGSIGNPGSADAPLAPEPKPRVSIAAQRVKDIPDWQNGFERPTPNVLRPQAPVSVFSKRVNGVPNFDNGAPGQQAKPQPPMPVFSQKVKGVADFSGEPAASAPRPEPPISVLSQKIASNVPRASVSPSGGGDFGVNHNVPKPNPRPAFQQQQQQQYEQQYEQGYAPVEDPNNTAPPPSIPLPDYNQHNQAPNHQDRLTNMEHSFMVNPDDRIGRMQDEYLR